MCYAMSWGFTYHVFYGSNSCKSLEIHDNSLNMMSAVMIYFDADF